MTGPSEFKIYKYAIAHTGKQVLTLPKGSTIIDAAVQNNNLVLWAFVKTGEPLEDRQIAVYPTGHKIDDTGIVGWKHIRTVVEGHFVWHVMEIFPETPVQQAKTSGLTAQDVFNLVADIHQKAQEINKDG